MTGDPVPELVCHDDHCITCGDDGLPMRVVEFDEECGLATCADADGNEAPVDVELVSPVAPGDSVLVHAGVALVRLEP